MSTKRLTDDERQAILATFRETDNVRETAKRHQRSPSTVSKIVADAGLEPSGRSQTKTACEAKQADNAARRAALASGLLDDAERLRAQLFAPTTVFNFGGKDNTYAERTIPEPSFADKRHIMGAVRMAATTARDLERVDQDPDGFSAVDEWLRGMLGDVAGEVLS